MMSQKASSRLWAAAWLKPLTEEILAGGYKQKPKCVFFYRAEGYLFSLLIEEEAEGDAFTDSVSPVALLAQGICGVEPGPGYDGVSYTLSILCLAHTLVLGFSSKDALLAWDARVRYSLGEGEHRVSTQFAKLPSERLTLLKTVCFHQISFCIYCYYLYYYDAMYLLVSQSTLTKEKFLDTHKFVIILLEKWVPSLQVEFLPLYSLTWTVQELFSNEIIYFLLTIKTLTFALVCLICLHPSDTATLWKRPLPIFCKYLALFTNLMAPENFFHCCCLTSRLPWRPWAAFTLTVLAHHDDECF